MRIAVIGAGFVGLTTAGIFAELGNNVVVMDSEPYRIATLQKGKIPFHEPGLLETLRRGAKREKLTFTSNMNDAVSGAEAIFLCVGTPQASDGSIDLTYIQQASTAIGLALSAGGQNPIVVVKSTVVPGTTATVVAPAIGAASGQDIPVAANPEFLKEGTALFDARNPDRIIIGADDDRAAPLWRLYESYECPKLSVPTRTAEMTKYVANSFLAVKIAFANEMANICDEVDVNWNDVVGGIGHDARINPSFFDAGWGFGGSCFPKDVAALSALAKQHGKRSGLLEAALQNNDVQPLRAVQILELELGNLEGKRIALLGLSFKPDTDDVRETRALPILNSLLAKGAEVICHDPQANSTFLQLAPLANIVTEAKLAIAGSDAVILQTAWPQYRQLDPEQMVKEMRGSLIVDGRRVLDPALCRAHSLKYIGIGLGH